VHFAFLIRFGIVIRLSKKREAYAFGMFKISVTAFSPWLTNPALSSPLISSWISRGIASFALER
jgi:hypothetical protein